MSPDSSQALQDFLKRHSNHADSGRRMAAFDCDGTVIGGDIGEAMFYRQIEQFHFRISPADIWSDCPDREEIGTLFALLSSSDPEERVRLPAYGRFAELLLSWYFGQIRNGQVAKACSDIVRLFAGFTVDEVRQLAEENFVAESGSPLTIRTLGGRTLPMGLRYLRESVDLLRDLRERGFEIWAISGSNKWSVEPVFKRLGVPAERVIGIELLQKDGRLAPTPDSPIPIRQGKVEALRKHRTELPLLTASDSRNDIPLFLYATEARVRINYRRRDTDEFFRVGNIPRDSSWILIEEPSLVS